MNILNRIVRHELKIKAISKIGHSKTSGDSLFQQNLSAKLLCEGNQPVPTGFLLSCNFALQSILFDQSLQIELADKGDQHTPDPAMSQVESRGGAEFDSRDDSSPDVETPGE